MIKTGHKNYLLVFVLLIIMASPAGLYAKDAGLTGEDTAPKADEKTSLRFFGKKVIPIINLDALGTYSKIQGYNATEGALIDLLISPAVKITDKHYLIPLYNFNYNRSRQIIAEDEGGHLIQETMIHNAYFTNKLQLTDNLVNKVSLFGSWAYYKETADEKWSEGLYDYIDVGGIVDFEYVLGNPKDKIYKEAGLEFEYYRREYSNFKSLISLALPTAPETDEKDFDGYKATLSYLRDNPDDLSFEASYQPLFKNYNDKLIIGSDGVLESGNKREDNQHAFNLNFTYPVNKRLKVSLDNELVINRSNQNFYDSMDTVILSDDAFLPDYYDYNSFKIKPKVTYDIAIKKEKDLTVQLSYAYLDKRYTDRKAQSSAGPYTGSDEEDEFHTFSLGLSYPLTETIKAVAMFDYTIAESNMEYEKYYRYNYDLMSIACGISCRF
ncbi:MAG: hypothetical protein KAU12_01690 [Candidatus Omnitrophica bacterium]|nr:hypothetical protein [Candidatus Omnitrophota bacterium]